MKHLYLQDRVKKGVFAPNKVTSGDNKSDGFSKILPIETFFKWVDGLGVKYLGVDVFQDEEKAFFQIVRLLIEARLGKRG